MNKVAKGLTNYPGLNEQNKETPKRRPIISAKEKSGKRKVQGSAKLAKNWIEKPTVKDVIENKPQLQLLAQNNQQLSFLGALVAQRALRKFMAPHRGLFSKFNFRRFSHLSLNVDGSIRLPILIEPTYQLAPTRPFVPRRVQPILEEVSEGVIDRTFRRSANINPGLLAKTLSNDVRVTLKGFGPPRYKYVVHTIITKLDGQSMFAASRVLWNPEFDCQFSFQYIRDNFIIQVTIFAFYHD